MTEGTGSPCRQALGALLRAAGRLASGFQEVEFDSATRACLAACVSDGDQHEGLLGERVVPYGASQTSVLGWGMLAVGRLRWKMGVVEPWWTADDGILDVRVDAMVACNPFRGAAGSAGGAFHLWLIAAMLLDDGMAFRAGASAIHDVAPLAEASTEMTVLRRIASHYDVSLRFSQPRTSSFSLCAWLWQYARLLSSGQRLRLLCWCCEHQDFRIDSTCQCHALILARTLHWLVGILSASYAAGGVDVASSARPVASTVHHHSDSGVSFASPLYSLSEHASPPLEMSLLASASMQSHSLRLASGPGSLTLGFSLAHLSVGLY